MKRRALGNSFPILGVLIAACASAQTKPSLTAQQIVERIQKEVGVPWHTPTVDTFKAGNPNTPVTGVAVTMMATLDVLQRAAAKGENFVITHEPTFYSHQDGIDALEKQGDAVLAAKEAFIREHHMVVWRFHDHWHMRKPDGIQLGMTKALGWEKFQNAENPHLFTLSETTLGDLAAFLKQRLGINVMRVVGDRDMKVTKIALIPGAAGTDTQVKALERGDVEVVIIGEVPEWETVEYVDDAHAAGMRKGLIMLTHIPSEQAGMEECTTWLKGFVTEVPVEFVAAKQPFWEPE
jgi:putative NIF3 family GTP cyclohydrolase 1 type 2